MCIRSQLIQIIIKYILLWTCCNYFVSYTHTAYTNGEREIPIPSFINNVPSWKFVRPVYLLQIENLFFFIFFLVRVYLLLFTRKSDQKYRVEWKRTSSKNRRKLVPWAWLLDLINNTILPENFCETNNFPWRVYVKKDIIKIHLLLLCRCVWVFVILCACVCVCMNDYL